MNSGFAYKRPFLSGPVVFIALALYYISFCRYGINLWDEGGLYSGGLRYFEGQRVLRDFFGYSPGRYYIVEAMFSLFGFEMLPVRYFIAAMTALFGLFSFQICRRIMPVPYALAALLLVASAPAVYYQRFYGLMALFNMWAAMVAIEKRRNIFWLVAACGLTYLFKFELLVIMLPVYLFLVYRFLLSTGMKRTVVFLSAAAIILAVYLSIFANSLGASFFPRLKIFYAQVGNPFPALLEGYQGIEFGFFPFMENLLFYLPFITAPVLIIIALKTEVGRRRDILLVLGYLQLSALSVVVFRAGFDNLIRCLPLFFIVAAYLSYSLVSRFDKQAIRIATAACLAVLCLTYLLDFNLNNGFYTGSIGVLKEVDSEVDFGRAAGIKVEAGKVSMIKAVTRWIEKTTLPGDPIFVLPLNPIWYYLSGRRNPTRYDWIIPATFYNREQEEELVGELRSDPPAVIVLVDIEIDNRPERRLASYAPTMIAWIADNYRYNGRVAYFQMWRRQIE